MRQTFLHRFWLLAFAIISLAISVQAQQDLAQAKETALKFLQSTPDQFNLTRQDVSDVRITDAYVTKHNGLTHVWVQQQHAGIPVYNALFGLHVKPNGEVLHLGHRFLTDLSHQVNTALPSLGAARALEIVIEHLGFSPDLMPGLNRKINERNFVFSAGKVARVEIPVEACYDRDNKGRPRLAWKMFFDQANTSDMWTITVDAQTGEIITQFNHTQYCKVGHVHRVGDVCQDEQPSEKQTTKVVNTQKLAGSVDEVYNVFPLPVESPAHGTRSLLTNPADPVASPYGWLDENGAAGPEFLTTRGNNVRAYDDRANDNTAATADYVTSTNYVFDFPYDPNAEPAGNFSAAVTNLFYMNNMMHDRYYQFGFDEVAGNFQQNSYGRGGLGNDAVRAEGLDGGGQDNANFATPADGGAPRMQMFLWTGASGNIVRVNAPSAVAGTYYAQTTPQPPSTGAWGGAITTTPITGEVVITDDGTGSDQATWNCKPLVNSLTGKIAIVDRGNCEFGAKALRAQQGGAIACIICNFEDATISMGAGAQGTGVTIPVVMMTKPKCDLLRQYVGSGLNISLVRPAVAGPTLLDGDFDNGIISHEYGHGISTRLTGGPANSGCLGNAEQMGEGWSDWFTLVNTVRPGDVGETRQGVGTFVFRQPNEGVGIRRVPYSTDMSIDPHTLATVAASTGVHAIGEVWATVTWDLYWAFVEKYGYDADWSNKNSGNYRAVQLVIDGMKLQPCSPGFIDGRNAIIQADFVNYAGVDTCLISSVFARRGMGIFANQGLSTDATDAVENFDAIPTCVKELKITKTTSTPTITAGENAQFTIKVVNHKEGTAEGVIVTDPLPAGLTLVSASNGGTSVGGVVTWNLGNMPTLAEITLTYTAKSDPASKSLLYFRDDMEAEDDRWAPLLNGEGSTLFLLQDTVVKVGTKAWKANALATETDLVLWHYVPLTINGSQPTLRFWHQFNTEAGADAGFVELKLEGQSTWRRLARDKGIRKGYTGSIQYGTFAIPYLNGFSGNSNGWVQSYFDISEFTGNNVTFQFRFGTDDNTTPANASWIIDRVDIIDLLNYNSEACVRSSTGDVACASAPERGVIVEPGDVVGTDDPVAEDALGLRVQPNPATDQLTLAFGVAAEGAVQVRLIGADGRLALQQNLKNVYAGQVLPLNIQHLPAGLYIVQVESSIGRSVAKVVKH
ncbi:MAG: M36 family metallopeptidase [Saprospiraceae bacterium]